TRTRVLMDPIETLLLRVLQGAATPAEQAEVQLWRDASPENEARYRETERLWTRLSEAAPDALVGARQPAEATVNRPRGRGRPRRPARRLRRARALAGLAAGAAAVVALGVIRPWRDDGPAAVAAREFATGRAEGVTFHLDEGSIV